MDSLIKATRTRKVIAGVLVLAALLVLAAVLAAWLLIDRDRIAQRLEARLSASSGMEVQIRKPLQLGLLPKPSVTIAGLEVSHQGQAVATVESISVVFATAPLLTGNLQPVDLHIRQPQLTVTRNKDGKFNLYRPDPGQLGTFSLPRLRVTDARLSYHDLATDREWLMEQCDLNLHTLHHGGGAMEEVLATLGAEGGMQCQSISQDRFQLADLSVELQGDQGAFELDPVTAKAFEGALLGRIEADLAAAPLAVHAESRLNGFDFGAFMRMLNPDQGATGKIDLELHLQARGKNWQTLRQSASGKLTMNATELTFAGYDLDEELEDYTETQRFNLIDVGAVFLAGPVGLAVTRGYAFTGMLEGNEGSTTIDQMVSDWAIEDGVASASDVAFRTPKHRLALTGGLDFGKVSFRNLRVAVVDSEGCAVVEQQITGPFHDPEIGKPNVLVAVTGPMLDLVERGVQAITNNDCDPFYTGSMPHP